MEMKILLSCAISAVSFAVCGDIQIVNGMKIECGEDGVCRIIGPADEDAGALPGEEPAEAAAPATEAGYAVQTAESAPPSATEYGRTALKHGYMDADDFLEFLEKEGAKTADGQTGESAPPEEGFPFMALLLAFLAGLALDLTPCVLPMVPVTLMVIGRSAAKGLLYAAGIVCAYTLLGVLAAFCGVPFGAIQSNPWFNTGVAVLFALFALAMSGLFFIDFSSGRNMLAKKKQTMMPGLFAFLMGVVGAILAGACVAPMMFATMTQAMAYSAAGRTLAAVSLPAAIGLGMALPWPFAAAGMNVLPRPGAWMKYVNRVFAAILLGFAAWYGVLAWRGFAGGRAAEGSVAPADFSLEGLDGRPVLVDCWATWCKNCSAMERTTMKDPRVVKALEKYNVIRLQAEDMNELKRLDGFEDVIGLPAFAIFKKPE